MSDVSAAQQAFITAELESFSTYLVEQAKTRLMARNIRANDELLNSLATEVATNELKLMFLDHGRMHDMGAGRGYHKGKFEGSTDRVQYLKGRKPSKWYSRLAWGSVYGRLVDNLQNRYIAEVPKLLTDTFRNGLKT